MRRPRLPRGCRVIGKKIYIGGLFSALCITRSSGGTFHAFGVIIWSLYKDCLTSYYSAEVMLSDKLEIICGSSPIEFMASYFSGST
jgi:hypothetical protein